MRARPPAQRKRTWSQKSQETSSEERFDLIIVGEGKSERIRPSLSRFLWAGEWANGLVRRARSGVAGGLTNW